MKINWYFMLPQENSLSISRLSSVFNNTTATYKYYWFISIIDLYSKEANPRISVWDLVIDMVSLSWYTIHYFKISFGKSDSLFDVACNIQRKLNIPIDSSKRQVYETIKQNLSNIEIQKELKVLTLNVPYRFLSPWITYTSDKQVISDSNELLNDCLYSLKKDDEFFIEINPIWANYILNHTAILNDFAYWNLTLFLQTRNPNVPNIPNKLIRPESRNSLATQRNYWNTVIKKGGAINCIFTGKEIMCSYYDLDHFIPWSFITHDLIWNLNPIDSSINSSKSDKIPDIDFFLPKFANQQQRALRIFAKDNNGSKLLDDFVSLGTSVDELLQLSSEDFLGVYRKTFNPLSQIAINMGFEQWNYKF